MTLLGVSKAITFLAVGVLAGFVAFWVTSWQPMSTYLGPLDVGRVLEHAGFDPWTGMGHGRVYESVVVTGSGLLQPGAIVREPGFRTWLGTRHAIPVPLGAVAAWIGMAFVRWARRRRRRSSAAT